MAASQQLVNRWNERLVLGERLLTNPSPRLRWLGRVYVRLYRFLLSVYGSGEWRSDTPSTQGEDESLAADGSANRMPFVDLTSHDAGAPAKSLEQIRRTLKSVHSANARAVERGPLQNGLQQENWIALGETRKARAGVLREVLRKFNIESQLRPNARREIIYVRYRDFERASVIFKELSTVQSCVSQPDLAMILLCPPPDEIEAFRIRASKPAQEPQSTAKSSTRAELGAVYGFIIGPFVCLMIIAALTLFQIVPKKEFIEFDYRLAHAFFVGVIWLICVFLGAWIGHRSRPRHRRDGRDAAK